MSVNTPFVRAHEAVVARPARAADDWLTGLAARLVFASVLLSYYLVSASTKLGAWPNPVTLEGLKAMLMPQAGAYAQILPGIAEQYNFSVDAIPLWPYKIIVWAGTYAELILPILIVVGLLTRLAALGMIGFVLVQSYVDVFVPRDGVTVTDTLTTSGPQPVGMMFDRFPGAMILDQRLLWIFLLLVLVLRGAGALSLDRLFIRAPRAEPSPEELEHDDAYTPYRAADQTRDS